LNTQGSSYDTVLAVYTGSPGALTSIACNDDVTSGTVWSSLSGVALSSATHYYVEVASYGTGAGGTLFLQGSYTGTIQNPAPVATVLSPSVVSAGDVTFTLVVTGSGFIPASVVQWNGVARTMSYVGASQLSAQIPASDIASPTTATVTVFTPAPGGGTSAGLPLSVRAQSKVGFTQQPAGATAGAAFTTQPVVAVQDVNGVTVTTDNATVVTLALTGPAGAAVSCTGGLSKTAVSGLAAFSGCSVDVANTGYGLHATASPALTPADSASFTVAAAGATHLGFSQQPSNGVTGTALAVQPVVTIRDGSGATVTGDNSTVVTLSLTGSGTLTCSGGVLTATASAGLATFSGCSVNSAGNFSLHATSNPVLTPADSNTFTVTGPASKLAITQQPGPSITAVAFALQPIVAVEDATGATVVSDNSTTVTLSLSGPGGGVLTCSGPGLTQQVVNGAAAFTGCSVSGPDGSYTIHAVSIPVVTPVDTASFGLTGPATRLSFSQQPTGAVTNKAFDFQPVVMLQDAAGATVAADNATLVTVTATGPGVLSCAATTVTAIAGVASFAGCQVDTAGSYTLAANSSPALTAAASTAFLVTGPATKLAFTQQPSNGKSGVVLPTQPTVTVQDAAGATVAADSATSTTLTLSGPGAGTLSCTGSLSRPVVNGVASFAGCSVSAP
jgi:hypothetical protein